MSRGFRHDHLLGIAQLSAEGCTAIVVEVADGVFQRETGAIVEHPVFAEHVDAVLFAATDALCGIAGAKVEMVQVTDAAAAADGFRRALAAMDGAPSTQIALNFDGAPVYGQADYGHFSPAAAYDANRDRVLVLDVDRGWHEPYWVPVDIMLAALATLSRKDGTPRGYLEVTLAG